MFLCKRNILYFLFIIMSCVSVLNAQQTVGLFQNDPNSFKGHTLFCKGYGAYLIDHDGFLVHSWTIANEGGVGVCYLLENGNLLVGGRLLQEQTWDGTIVQTYSHPKQHHDLERLPNGNTLIISRETKSDAESIAAGRNPAYLISGNGLSPLLIIEIDPNNNVVWEWRSWDHMVQEYDPSKENYGIVEEHPELLDINFNHVRIGGDDDLMHTNAIDYNPQLDQIVVSPRRFSELWVIDHSTSTQESAGHTGGNSGKGGDILYRWGNPQAYAAGDIDDKQLIGQHDTQWIEPGLPGEGNFLIFNNGLGRPEGNYSTIEEIVPPVEPNGYYLYTAGNAYGPDEPIWNYTADSPTDFYAINVSGVQRLANGNTLICSGPSGYFFEVTAQGQTVWDYISPVTDVGVITQGDPVTYTSNRVFRCYRYALDYPGLAGRDLTPGDPLELCPVPGDVGGVCFVDINDFSRFGEYWAETGCGTCGGADFTGDGNVDLADMVVMAANWLTGYE
jgi:hypothetical protein